MVEINGGRFAHASGALWIAGAKTLIAADLHIGYGWAQRRRGELGPLQDAAVAEKLVAVLDELAPDHVVLLGDVVHAPKPALGERALIQQTLESIRSRARLTLVCGNHDRGMARDFGCELTAEFRLEGLTAIHGDRVPEDWEGHLVTGHYHPAYSIRDAAGAARRLPVFAVGKAATVLPAFSPYAAGFDLRDRPWPAGLHELLGSYTPRLIAATGGRVQELRRRG